MITTAFVIGVFLGALGLRASDRMRAWWDRTSWFP
jgi:hypothetical protein